METREKREAENIALLKRFYDEVVNGGNIAEIDNIWAPDMVWQMGGTVISGREAYKEMAQASVGGSFCLLFLFLATTKADSATSVTCQLSTFVLSH